MVLLGVSLGLFPFGPHVAWTYFLAAVMASGNSVALTGATLVCYDAPCMYVRLRTCP